MTSSQTRKPSSARLALASTRRSTDTGCAIRNFGFRIADFGTANRSSEIRNPKSEIRSCHLLHPLDERCGRVALQQREPDDAPALAPDDVAAHDLSGAPVSAFHEDVRPQPLDEALGGALVEDRHVINALELGEE